MGHELKEGAMSDQKPADEDGRGRTFGEPLYRAASGGRAGCLRRRPLRHCSGKCVIHPTTVMAAADEPQYNSDVQNNPSAKSWYDADSDSDIVLYNGVCYRSRITRPLSQRQTT